MALPTTLQQREYKKFIESGGETAVRVVGTIGGTEFDPPSNADSITAEYPNSVTEIYKYRTGGLVGTVVKTITVVYLDSTKADISSVEVT